MGLSPGLIHRFTPEQVSSKKLRMRYSLHEGDLLNTIDLSRRLGECPDDITIFENVANGAWSLITCESFT